MATRKQTKEQAQAQIIGACAGGRSWQFYQDQHKPGKIPDIYCYRCKTRMGCSACCEKARELLCMECHNWATKTALAHHGNIVPNFKVPRVRTDEGWITHHPLTDRVNLIDKQGIKALVDDPPF